MTPVAMVMRAFKTIVPMYPHRTAPSLSTPKHAIADESESESEYLFGHLDPVTPAKTVADRCRRGHHQNIQYILIT